MSSLMVRTLMTDTVYALRPQDDLATLRDLMDDRRVRHVPVLDSEGTLVGLVSQRDLLRVLVPEEGELPAELQSFILANTRVEEIMTRSVETIDADADIREAAQILFDNKIGCLPVVEGAHVVGILTESDFVRFLARNGIPTAP